MTNAAEQFLNPGSKSAKFENIGDTISGVVVAEPEVRQQTDFNTGEPSVWKDGTPKMQLLVQIQTEQRDGPDDDGIRTIYVKGKSLTNAVREATRKAGSRSVEQGGTLTVKYVADGEAVRRGQPPAKLYSAEYTKPSASASAAFLAGKESTDALQSQPADRPPF